MTPAPRLTAVLCSIVIALLAAPAGAEVFVEVFDAREPAQLTASTLAPKLADGPALVVPYYQAKTAGDPGENTLYAVRNNSSSAVAVRVSYFDAAGGAAVRIDEVVLDAHAVETVNLHLVPGLPREAGTVRGFILIEALDTTLPANVISGDFFRVDAEFSEANGGTMMNADTTDCRQWSHRFLSGGGFDGGTRIAFLVLDAPTQGPALIGNVYSEAGELVNTIEVTTNETAFELTDADLDLKEDFGSIDWVFQGDGHGAVSTTFTATGVLSVGMEASCTEGTEEPSVPGAVVFELPGNFLTCRNCANWQYDMPFDGPQQFSKVIVDFDVFIAGWDPAAANGFHCLFWLNNGDRWQDMMGYLNSRGTQNRMVFQSNGPLGSPIGVEVYTRPGVQPGQNYHVHYEYDTVEKGVWYEIRDASGAVVVAEFIQLPSNVGKLSTSYTFIQFGSQPSAGPEALTEGWRWSNFKAQFLP